MFRLRWTEEAARRYSELKAEAQKAFLSRRTNIDCDKEGAFKHVHHCIRLLAADPNNNLLTVQTYKSLDSVYPGHPVSDCRCSLYGTARHRVFWTFGPEDGELGILAIAPDEEP